MVLIVAKGKYAASVEQKNDLHLVFVLKIRVFLSYQRYMTSTSKDHEQLFDLIEKMLDYDPSKRLSLARCLHHPFFSCYHQSSTADTGDQSVEL